MSALAEDRRTGPLKLQLEGLRLRLGRPEHAFEVILEPAIARKLAADLLVNADEVEARADQAMADLSVITRGEFLGD